MGELTRSARWLKAQYMLFAQEFKQFIRTHHRHAPSSPPLNSKLKPHKSPRRPLDSKVNSLDSRLNPLDSRVKSLDSTPKSLRS